MRDFFALQVTIGKNKDVTLSVQNMKTPSDTKILQWQKHKSCLQLRRVSPTKKEKEKNSTFEQQNTDIWKTHKQRIRKWSPYYVYCGKISDQNKKEAVVNSCRSQESHTIGKLIP